MDVGAIMMDVPVVQAQAGPPNAQSAPCTPQKSSLKFETDSDDDAEEDGEAKDVSPTKSPSSRLCSPSMRLRRRPMLRVRLLLSWEKIQQQCWLLLFDSDAEEVGENKKVSCRRRVLQRKQLEFETEQMILM